MFSEIGGDMSPPSPPGSAPMGGTACYMLTMYLLSAKRPLNGIMYLLYIYMA